MGLTWCLSFSPLHSDLIAIFSVSLPNSHGNSWQKCKVSNNIEYNRNDFLSNSTHLLTFC